MAYRQGDYPAARTLHEESLAIKRARGDRLGTAGSLNNLGALAYDEGNYAAARGFFEESLAIARELGDRWPTANFLSNLGSVAYEEGDYAAAPDATRGEPADPTAAGRLAEHCHDAEQPGGRGL